jgi:hypothetical protein
MWRSGGLPRSSDSDYETNLLSSRACPAASGVSASFNWSGRSAAPERSELCAGEFWRLPVFFFVVLFSAALEGRPLSQARATLLESKDKR